MGAGSRGEIIESPRATSGPLFEFEFKPPAPIRTLQKIFKKDQPTRTLNPGSIIYSPQDPEFTNPLGLTWLPVDFDPSTGEWSGTVGYAGIKTGSLQPPLDLYGCAGIKLTVKGEGQRLKFGIRFGKDTNGILWSYSFDTSSLLDTEVKIPFFDLLPTKFDRVAKNAPSFNLASVSSFQL